MPREQARAWAVAGGVRLAVTRDSLGRKGQARAILPRQAHRGASCAQSALRPSTSEHQGWPRRETRVQSSPFKGNDGPGGEERPPFLLAIFFLPCLIQRADLGEQVALAPGEGAQSRSWRGWHSCPPTPGPLGRTGYQAEEQAVPLPVAQPSPSHPSAAQTGTDRPPPALTGGP